MSFTRKKWTLLLSMILAAVLIVTGVAAYSGVKAESGDPTTEGGGPTEGGDPTGGDEPIEIEWGSLVLTYNGQPQAPTATYNGQQVTVTVNGQAIEVGDNYTATASLEGYTISEPTKTFSIIPRTVTLTPASKEKDYGAEDPELTYTLSDETYRDQVTGKLAREEGENVGEYAITLGTIASDNLDIDFQDGAKLTIGKRTVKLTPKDGQSKVFDTDEPELEYELDDETYRDQVTGKLAREEGENVGEYAITLGTIASDNLEIKFTEGVKFEITERPVTLTPKDGQSKVFDTDDPEALEYTLTDADGTDVTEKYKDQITGKLAREGQDDVISDGGQVGAGQKAGTYAITLGTVESNNLEITFTAGKTFEITAREVKVVPDANQSKIYAEDDPKEYTFTVEVSGANHDGAFYHDYLIGGSLTREEGEDVGEYAYIASTLTDTTGGSLVMPAEVENKDTVKFEITKRPVTLTPKDGQSKIFDTDDPETLEYTLTDKDGTTDVTEKFKDQITGKLAREGQDDVISEDGTIGTGQKAGSYAITIGTIESANLEIAFTEGVQFEITARTVQVIPDAEQSKTYAAANPEEYTYSIGLTDPANHDGAFYHDHWIGGSLTREEGEAVGEYAYIASTLTDGTGGSLVMPADVENKDTVKFTIEGAFAGTVLVLDFDKITNRTRTVTVTVSGIEADLSGAQATLTLTNDVKTEAFAADGDYTLSIPFTVDGYKYWLTAGNYTLTMNAPKKDGGIENVAELDVTVAQDQLTELSAGSSLYTDAGSLIGPYGSGAEIHFDPANFEYKNAVPFEAGANVEELTINSVTITAENGYSASVALPQTTFYVSGVTTLFTEADLASYVAGLFSGNPDKVDIDRVTVTVDAAISSGDLAAETPIKIHDTFTYDFQAKPCSVVTHVDNRTYDVTLNFGEDDCSIISVTPPQGFTLKEFSDNKVSLAYDVHNLPKSGGTLTVVIQDKAGNTYTKALTGIGRASADGISDIRISPVTEEDSKMYVGGAFRISGRATCYETLNIVISDTSGQKYLTDSVTVPGSADTWSSSDTGFWSLTFRDSDLNLPRNKPLQLSISYANVNGGSYKTILIYDDKCQQPILLTPVYSGMKILAGYAEPGAEVTVILEDEEVTVTADYKGYFKVEFEDGVYDSQIAVVASDIVNNTTDEIAYEVPVRFSDVENRITNAYPIGAMIQDDTGMVRLIATPVALEDLAEGPIELPMLTASFFKVGTITIAMDEEGRISFTPVIDEPYRVENAASYFNVYSAMPAANALDADKRGEGMRIEDGYMPEAKADSFWFVYEVQAAFTADQITMAEDTEFIDINSDHPFHKYQLMADD